MFDLVKCYLYRSTKRSLIKAKLYIVLFSLFPYFLINTVFGQAPASWHITDEEGLPSVIVYRTIQDQKGFMWIGTESGLCKFDGVSFKRFNSNLLNDNEILALFEDKKGRIWFSNLSNQICYIENDEIHLFPLGIEDVNNIRDIYVNDNKIYLLIRFTKSNAYQILKVVVDKDLNVIEQNKPNFFDHTWGYFSQTDTNELMFFGLSEENGDGFFAIDTDSLQLNKIDTKLQRINYFKIFNQKKNNKETINDLHLLDVLLQHYTGKSIPIEGCFIIDNYFIAFTRSTTYIHEKELIIPKKIRAQQILNKIHISNITKDREGNYWISTIGQGIHVIPSMNFLVYNTINSDLPDNYVHSLGLLQSNQLLVGSSEGKVVTINDKGISKITAVKYNSKVNPILQSPHGTVYLGTKNGVIALDSTLTKQNLIYPTFLKSFAWKDNNLWVGTSSSTYRILLKKKTHEETYTQRQKAKRILQLRTYALLTDQHTNKLWIGTTQGIYLYDEEAIPFLENGKHEKYRVSDIKQARDSTIWVATHNDGILGIKNDSIHFRFNEDNLLVSNFSKVLFIDEEEMLWIGTDKGLVRLNLNNHNDVLYMDKTDGLPVNEISAIISYDGLMWIGTPKGLVSFNPKSIKLDTIASPMYISAFSVWEKDTTLSSNYVLDYNQNNIKIDYAGINYASRGVLNYHYRMIGIDTNWVETKTNYVRFPSLSTGGYTFQVKAMGKNDVDSSNIAALKIYIKPPWWLTKWFRFLLGLSGGIGLYVIFRFFDKKQKQDQEIKERINNLKMQALQAQMNPHFVFNAMYAIQNFLVTNKQEEALIYLARFAKLIRLIFEQSRKQLITLEEEIEFISLYLDLEKLRFRDKIEIQLKVAPILKNRMETIHIPPLLIQPIIENCFKHGLMHKKEKGILKINFDEENNFLHCVVEDNGVGRKLAQELSNWDADQHNPSGIETTRERLQITNQLKTSKNKKKVNNLTIIDLYDQLGNASGTKIDIEIKYQG